MLLVGVTGVNCDFRALLGGVEIDLVGQFTALVATRCVVFVTTLLQVVQHWAEVAFLDVLTLSCLLHHALHGVSLGVSRQG